MREAASPTLLSLIVPVFREGEAAAGPLSAIEQNLRVPHETLAVYDFDEDPTVAVVERLARTYPSLCPVRNRIGPGIPNAIRAGFAAARGERLIVTMADGSDDPRDYGRILEAFENGADIVCPSRYRRGGRRIGGPRLAGMLSRLAGLSLHLAGALPVTDATNAFKGYRRRVIDAIPLEGNGGFAYTLELVTKAHAAGCRFDEFPTTWRGRIAGQSNFRLLAWLPAYLKWYFRALFRAV